MSGDGRQQLQKALYETLTTALLTAGAGGAAVPVYDHVPQDSSFDYVRIGDLESGEWDTTTELGQEHDVDIHVFMRSDKLGKKQAQQLQKLVYDALHQAELVLDAGAALVDLRCTFQTTFTEPDGITQHGVSHFTAQTTEA